MIDSACSSCAQRNAALISLGRYDEPTSIHEYLSTTPRENRFRFVPFSHRISARSTHSGRLTIKAPPSPAITFLVSWKLTAEASPIDPSGRPLYAAITPCAASSMTNNPRSRAIRQITSISQLTPA